MRPKIVTITATSPSSASPNVASTGIVGGLSGFDALTIIDISNNLGDSRTLMTHPASTTHASVSEAVRAEMGITEGMLRLSVGLEDVDDLIDDLDQALKSAGL